MSTISPNEVETVSDRVPQLHMRHDLRGLPDLAIPAGYALRALTHDDLAAWADLLDRNGELGEWSAERARPFFSEGSRMPLEGSCFVTWGSEPVATAQLHQHPDGPYAPTPELGWVAVDPAHRGRGLGYVACLAVLRYAASKGYEEVFLLTDDHRLPAIRTYLRLGFRPWMYDATAGGRWAVVLEELAAHVPESEREGWRTRE